MSGLRSDLKSASVTHGINEEFRELVNPPRCRAYPPLVLSVRNLDDAEEKNIYNDYRFRITFLPRIIQLINRIARVLQPPQGQIQTLGDAGEEKKKKKKRGIIVAKETERGIYTERI